jgi:hypothetical protein
VRRKPIGATPAPPSEPFAPAWRRVFEIFYLLAAYTDFLLD